MSIPSSSRNQRPAEVGVEPMSPPSPRSWTVAHGMRSYPSRISSASALDVVYQYVGLNQGSGKIMATMTVSAGRLSLSLTQFIVSLQSERAVYPSSGIVSGPYTVRASCRKRSGSRQPLGTLSSRKTPAAKLEAALHGNTLLNLPVAKMPTTYLQLAFVRGQFLSNNIRRMCRL